MTMCMIEVMTSWKPMEWLEISRVYHAWQENVTHMPNIMFCTWWKFPNTNNKNLISKSWISIMVSVTRKIFESFCLINGLKIFQKRNKSYHECSNVMIQWHRDKWGLNPQLGSSQSRDASRAMFESQVDDGNSLTRSATQNCTKTEWITIVKLLHAVFYSSSPAVLLQFFFYSGSNHSLPLFQGLINVNLICIFIDILPTIKHVEKLNWLTVTPLAIVRYWIMDVI